jgi:hypothetical protein
MEPELSDSLHSFRKGHSAWQALGLLRDYLLVYRSAVTTTARGLYVLRRDIAKYGDSLDVSVGSRFSTAIEQLIGADPDRRRRNLVLPLIRAAIRQPVSRDSGEARPLLRGTPTGSPIQPPLLNYALMPLDRRLSSLSGGFYSRFGDDVLLVHPDHEVIGVASEVFDDTLRALHLSSNLEKCRDLYFNGAGRPPPGAPSFTPVQSVEYLGAAISFSGQLGLKSAQQSKLLRQLWVRLNRIAEFTRGAPLEERASLLCASVRCAFDPRHPLAIAGTDRLFSRLDDRSQMRELDYRIALIVAQLATGKRGARAFRELSRAQQKDLGIVSLRHARQRRSTEFPVEIERKY